MAIVSYLLGQKYYPVDYDVKRLLGYIGLGVGLYIARGHLTMIAWQPWLLGSALMMLYLLITALCEYRQSRN
jgi:hypothetical protein